MFLIVDQQLPPPGESGRGTARLLIEGTAPPADVPSEVRLQFEFDTVPPSEVFLEPGSGHLTAVERKGPAAWRAVVDPDQVGEIEVRWVSPESGARLVEARWTTAQDDDRPEKFFENLLKLLEEHSGPGAIEKDRRFFLELDFVTRLLMDDWLKAANEEHAKTRLGIPAAVFDANPPNVNLDVKEPLASHPLARAHAAIQGGDLGCLESYAIQAPPEVASIALAFRTLIDKYYASAGVPAFPTDAGMALARFANGALRRGQSDDPTDSESTRAFNCEPDGFLFPTFAEFAEVAWKASGEDEEDWWFDFLKSSIAAIHVFGDVYWDRAKPRIADAYRPEFYAAKRAWSEADLDALMKRTLALEPRAVRLQWGLISVELLRDEPNLESPC